MSRWALPFGVLFFASPAAAVPRFLAVVHGALEADVTEHVVVRDGRTLHYRVHWPRASSTPAPVVLALHGRPRRPARNPYHMLGIGREDPFGEAIVIAPFIDWDAPWSDTQPMILQALREVAQRRAVDRHRVSLAGFSMGAPSALYLARNRPRTFSAVFAASGHFPEDTLDDLADHRTRVLLTWSGSGDECRRTVALTRRISMRGGEARALVFPGGEHEAHLELFSNPDTWRWFVGTPGEPAE
jgi:poly(3-hydroxybutyrate) depolymerase